MPMLRIKYSADCSLPGLPKWIYLSISKNADPKLVREITDRLLLLKSVCVATYDKSEKYNQVDLIACECCIIIPPKGAAKGSGREVHYTVGRGNYEEAKFFKSYDRPVYVFAELDAGILVREIKELTAMVTDDWNKWGVITTGIDAFDLTNFNFVGTPAYYDAESEPEPEHESFLKKTLNQTTKPIGPKDPSEQNTESVCPDNATPTIHMALLSHFIS